MTTEQASNLATSQPPVHAAPGGAAVPCAHDAERRGFFRRLTALGAVAAAFCAGVPLVGYFLGRRPRRVFWVPLGAVDNFPEGETRMVTFDNPLRQVLPQQLCRSRA